MYNNNNNKNNYIKQTYSLRVENENGGVNGNKKSTVAYMGQRLPMNSATYIMNSYAKKFRSPGTKFILVMEDILDEDEGTNQNENTPQKIDDPDDENVMEENLNNKEF